MSPERTQAYKRVMRTLSDLGPSKLLTGEQDRIRAAADTLVFSGRGDEHTVEDALADIDALCRDLIASGRWEPVTAQRLARDLRDCGPHRAVDEALRAA
jgi:hypothetical protein